MKSKLTLLSIATAVVLFSSCTISGVTGNKNVVKETRNINENFTSVKVSEGINLFLSQSDKISVVVEADENIQNLLITKVENGILKIYFKDMVGKATKNVYVSVPVIEKISASSAADVKTKTLISSKELIIEASSGAEIEAEIESENLTCESSSGADIDLTGTSSKANFRASSGADIDAKELEADTVTAESSSGGDVSVFATKKLSADASSGGDINYYGNPEKIEVNTSSGGDINKKTK
ncbi:MAG: DUF2807 domain-containing protein [Bacteroidales bacterium]|nr:DUF2807 domain-containing protein [Bacteroidales bacterium]